MKMKFGFLALCVLIIIGGLFFWWSGNHYDQDLEEAITSERLKSIPVDKEESVVNQELDSESDVVVDDETRIEVVSDIENDEIPLILNNKVLVDGIVVDKEKKVSQDDAVKQKDTLKLESTPELDENTKD